MKFSQILLLMHLIISKIPVIEIKKVVKNLKLTSKFPDFEHSVINPIFGHLFESTGALSNLRFYAPEFGTDQGKRLYSKDHSEDSLISLIIELFPSPTGTISHMRTMNGNFGFRFFQNKVSGIEFLSEIFVEILLEGEKGNYKCYDTQDARVDTISNAKLDTILDTRQYARLDPLFRTCRDTCHETCLDMDQDPLRPTNQNTRLDMSQNLLPLTHHDTGKSPGSFIEFQRVREILKKRNLGLFTCSKVRDLKLLTIHSFILNALDDKSDLEFYLFKILSKIKANSFEKYSLSFDLWNEILKIHEKFMNFPYSELNQPSSCVSIPVYDRQKKEFVEKELFSDCSDIILLHICNCLFYDPVLCRYSTEGSNISTELSLFYNEYNQIFTITTEIRKNWSRVVQGLEDFKNIDNSEFKTHLIVYLKEKRNEIKSGVVNMMNILIKICEINHTEFWSDFNGINIGKKLVDLFTLILMKINKNGNVRIVIDYENFVKFKSKKRTDFIGCFDLEFIQPGGVKIIAKVTLASFHSEIFISSDASRTDNCLKIGDELCNDISLPILLIKNYILFGIKKSKNEKFDKIFKKLLFNGIIHSIESKNDRLIDICKHLIEESNKIENGASVLVTSQSDVVTEQNPNIILNPSNLVSDQNPNLIYNQSNLISNQNDNFILNQSDLLSDQNPNLISSQSILKSSQNPNLISNQSILKSSQNPNLKSSQNPIEIHTQSKNNFSIKPDYLKFLFLNILNSIDRNDLHTKKLLYPFLFLENNLSDASVLESFVQSLTIEECAVYEFWIPKVSSLELESALIDIFDVSDLGLSILFKTLFCMKNLKNLKFIGLHKKNRNAFTSQIRLLTKLNKLDVSSNRLGPDGIKLILNAIEETQSLKEINLSNNYLGYTEAIIIAESVIKLKNLESLDISINAIGSIGAETILKLIENHSNLKNVNLSRNFLSEEKIEMIRKEIQRKNIKTRVIF